MRRITIEPGGQFALHNSVQEGHHRLSGRRRGRQHVAAVGLRIRHWEENRGTDPVVVIAMDIVKK